MSDTDSAPPLYHVSSNDHGPWVVVTSYIFLIFSIMFVVTKLLSRFQLTKLTLGDGFVLIAIVGTSKLNTLFRLTQLIGPHHEALALMQTIFITYACNYGLGRHMNTLDASSLGLYSKVCHQRMCHPLASGQHVLFFIPSTSMQHRSSSFRPRHLRKRPSSISSWF